MPLFYNLFKIIFIILFSLCSYFISFSQPNLKIGFGGGRSYAKNNIWNFSDIVQSDFTNKIPKNKVSSVLIEIDLDGKNSICTSLSQVIKGWSSFNMPGEAIYFGQFIREVPLQYSRYFFLSNSFFLRCSSGLFLDFLKKHPFTFTSNYYESSYNTQNGSKTQDTTMIIVRGEPSKNINFTFGASLSFGFKLKKIGSFDISVGYNHAITPLNNYEIEVIGKNPSLSRTVSNGSYRSIEIAYYYPLIRLKNEHQKKD